MKCSMVFLVCAAVAFLTAIPGNVSAKGSSSSNSITGKVTAGSGPARSVWVVLYDGTQEKGRSLTGDDGRYYIGNLASKAYTLVVRKQIAGSNLVNRQVTLPANRVFNVKLP